MSRNLLENKGFSVQPDEKQKTASTRKDKNPFEESEVSKHSTPGESKTRAQVKKHHTNPFDDSVTSTLPTAADDSNSVV